MPATDDYRAASRVLADIAHALAAHDDVSAGVTAALELVGGIVAYDRCALLETVTGRQRFALFTVPLLVGPQHVSLTKHLIALCDLLGEDECDLGKSVIGLNSHLAVPVLGLDEAKGVLWVERESPAYNETELRLLSIVAIQLGSYLASRRLREGELERATQLGLALRRLEETDRDKDEFLAMLGHELRNPLGAINTALSGLDGSTGAANETSRYHCVIDRQLHHLTRIVDDLLNASRVRLGKIVLQRERLDLRVVAERWLEALGGGDPQQDHRIVQSSCAEPVCVDGDPVRLEQIVSYLLTNAIKYTPHGGLIRIAVAKDEAFGVLTVSDTGVGMTPELLASAFDLFTQAEESISRSRGGLGLGLSLVRSLVEMHGGTVEISSAGLGAGTEVVVRLPLATVRTDANVEKLEAAANEGSSVRVLVVEDNDDAREILTAVLEQWGHRVQSVADGLIAVARATSEPFDVMLIDIGLPGIDGYEVARRVLGDHKQPAPLLVAMTGYGQPEDQRRATDAGFNEYMVKPIPIPELKKRLSSVRAQEKLGDESPPCTPDPASAAP